MNRHLPLLIAAVKAYDRSCSLERCDRCGAEWRTQEWGQRCPWCGQRRQTDHDWILQPPAPRGYGYATCQDLASLGYDQVADRQTDLKRWAHDLELAVEAGLITQHEGEAAVKRAVT